jgi:hypothetical protein
MITNAQLEVAARDYCAQLGLDPDEVVGQSSPFPVAGQLPGPAGEPTAARWTFLVDKLRVRAIELQAVQAGLLSPP